VFFAFTGSRFMSSQVALSPAKASAIAPETLTHLQRLEAESIQIFREIIAECEKPVMLYSIGKDSAVMLHLAAKAFYPSPPPFPLLHDTTCSDVTPSCSTATMCAMASIAISASPTRIGSRISGVSPRSRSSWRTLA
jgi:hypothetical protein